MNVAPGMVARRAGWAARGHGGWWAFAVHRISGIALSVFLPVHFLALAQALAGEAALDGFLRWTERPWVKVSEIVLVFLLAVHLAGGVRLLAIEFGGYVSRWQPTLIAAAFAVSLAAALAFALNLV